MAGRALRGRANPGWRFFVTLILLIGAVSVGVWIVIGPLSWGCRNTEAGLEIFQGGTYGCKQLDRTEEGSGALHWVRVDLAAPGLELYVTPLDPQAVAHGREYRLRRVNEVVEREHLAVAINGALFTSASNPLIRLPGDFASSIETAVSNHVVNHLWEHTYLLWFDDALTPHLRPSKPPTDAELGRREMGYRRPSRVALQR
jgi:hypothetical protein